MSIEEIIFLEPVPKQRGFINSDLFAQVLLVKSTRLDSLLQHQEKVENVIFQLKDLGNCEKLIVNKQILIFLKYLIGTKYIELGLKYDNDEYLIDGINELDEVIEDLLSSFDLKANYYRLFARGILVHFNNELEKNTEYQYSFENIKPLLKAKYYLFKLFSFLIEDNIRLKKVVESRVISDLISVLLFLSRWNEPFYILDKRTVITDYSPGFLNYLKAHTLNEIAYNTCCTIYPAMTVEVKRFIKKGMAVEEENDYWKKHLSQINQEIDGIIKDNKIDFVEFESKYNETQLDINVNGHTLYRKWTLENHLALNEHSIYCCCELSKKDDLRIRSSHQHTQIEWTNQFETILDKIKSEFILSRDFLFRSHNENTSVYVRSEEIQFFSDCTELVNNSTSDCLIQAFKAAYSILDKIGRAIYFALNIQKKEIHFHNCWKEIKEKRNVSHNRYLYSLYSIACDLSETTKYSAFREYKKWRNSIEHEFFFLANDTADIEKIKSENKIINEVVRISEFREKAYYMLQLSQSAIFSFVFFIRHESKTKKDIAG